MSVHLWRFSDWNWVYCKFNNLCMHLWLLLNKLIPIMSSPTSRRHLLFFHWFVTKFVIKTPQKLLIGILWNFSCSKVIICSWAYYLEILLIFVGVMHLSTLNFAVCHLRSLSAQLLWNCSSDCYDMKQGHHMYKMCIWPWNFYLLILSKLCRFEL